MLKFSVTLEEQRETAIALVNAQSSINALARNSTVGRSKIFVKKNNSREGTNFDFFVDKIYST